MSKFDPSDASTSQTPPEQEDAPDPGRRAALKAVQKYAAYVAGTSTVILSADEALAAPKFCSRISEESNPWLYYLFCDGSRPDWPPGNGNGAGQGNGNGNAFGRQQVPPGLQRFDRNSNGFRPQ